MWGAVILALVAGWFAWAKPSAHQPVQPSLSPSPTSSPSVSPTPPTPPILPTSFHLGGKLPWPLVATTSGGRFLIRMDGRVVALPRPARPKRAHFPYPPGSVGVDSTTGAVAELSHGRIVIRRGNSVIWRSRRRYPEPTATDMNSILLGPSGVAVEAKNWGPLYVAAGRGPERLVAANEFPVMWTRSSNLLTLAKDPRTQRFSYLLRSPSGGLLATLASGVGDASYLGFLPGTFLFWDSRGNLLWTDGAVTRFLTNYHALDLSSQPSAYPLDGGLIELLTGDWHEVIIRSDGSIFARASGPVTGSVAGFGEQTARPGGTEVVYALYGLRRTTVYLLKQGSTQGVRIYRTPPRTTGFDELPLSWHGRWVLFTPRVGRSVVIDTAGRIAPMVLPALLSRDNSKLKKLSWASAG
jgi:hypothetical protein